MNTQESMNNRQVAVLICTAVVAMICLYALYLIYKGALTFDENPISLDLTEGSLFNVILALWVPLSFILTRFETFTSYDIDRYGHATENGVDGCMTTIIYALLKPVILAIITYYVLWLIMQLVLFVLPYLAAILLVAGVVGFFFLARGWSTSTHVYPLVIVSILGIAVYAAAGYGLYYRMSPEMSVLENVVNTLTKTNDQTTVKTEQQQDPTSASKPATLVGTWRLISQKRGGKKISPKKSYQLTFTGVKDAASNSYELIEIIGGQKQYTSFTLLSKDKQMVTSLSFTEDTNDNAYDIAQLDQKQLVLRFSYLPEETEAGELIFERQ